MRSLACSKAARDGAAERPGAACKAGAHRIWHVIVTVCNEGDAPGAETVTCPYSSVMPLTVTIWSWPAAREPLEGLILLRSSPWGAVAVQSSVPPPVFCTSNCALLAHSCMEMVVGLTVSDGRPPGVPVSVGSPDGLGCAEAVVRGVTTCVCVALPGLPVAECDRA